MRGCGPLGVQKNVRARLEFGLRWIARWDLPAILTAGGKPCPTSMRSLSPCRQPKSPNSVQVFCFNSHVMIEAFDGVLAAREKKNPQFSYKSPIFIALDGSKKSSAPETNSGLKAKAKWQMSVPLADVRRSSVHPSASQFIDRVKREFAELNGVDISKVVIEFQIIT